MTLPADLGETLFRHCSASQLDAVKRILSNVGLAIFSCQNPCATNVSGSFEAGSVTVLAVHCETTESRPASGG